MNKSMSEYEYEETLKCFTEQVEGDVMLYKEIVATGTVSHVDFLRHMCGNGQSLLCEKILKTLTKEERTEILESLRKEAPKGIDKGLKTMILSLNAEHTLEKVEIESWTELVGYCVVNNVGVSSISRVDMCGCMRDVVRQHFNLELFRVLVKGKEDFQVLKTWQSTHDIPFLSIRSYTFNEDRLLNIDFKNEVDRIAGEGSYYEYVYTLLSTYGSIENGLSIMKKVVNMCGDNLVEILGSLIKKYTVYNISDESTLTEKEILELQEQDVWVNTRESVDSASRLFAMSREKRKHWILYGRGMKVNYMCMASEDLVKLNKEVLEDLRNCEQYSREYKKLLDKHVMFLKLIESKESVEYLAEHGCLLDTKPYLYNTDHMPHWMKGLNVPLGKLVESGVSIPNREEIIKYREQLFGSEKSKGEVSIKE